MEEQVPLSQKIYALGVHPQKGGIVSSAYSAMTVVLVGTLLMELYLNKKISFNNKRVQVVEPNSNNDLHRFLLQKMSRFSKSLRISAWINRLKFHGNHIRREVQMGLVDKRIIRLEKKQFLFFRWSRPVLLNKQKVYNWLNEIDSSIFKGTSDEELLILLSFLKPAGLLKRIFTEREKRKQAQKRLKKIAAGNQISAAVQEAIDAAHAVAASIAITTAATSAGR